MGNTLCNLDNPKVHKLQTVSLDKRTKSGPLDLNLSILRSQKKNKKQITVLNSKRNLIKHMKITGYHKLNFSK